MIMKRQCSTGQSTLLWNSVLPLGGAAVSGPEPGGGGSPAVGGPATAADLPEGPGQEAQPAPRLQRPDTRPQGLAGPAAAPEWQHAGTGGLVRAPSAGSAAEEAGWGGGLEEDQGGGGGPGGPAGAA